MFSFVTLLLLSNLALECLSDVYELNRAEAEHSGLPFTMAVIVNEFMKSDFSHSSVLNTNDYPSHHDIVASFCKYRNVGCSWKDYYNVLDHIRLPYAKLFDPGQERIGTPLHALQDAARSGYRHQHTCEVIEKPSASAFHKYVLGSKPVIIRGLLPKLKPLDWSFRNLFELIGDVEVVVSAAPTGEFDAPEDPSLWGVQESRDMLLNLIVRPAHLNVQFSEFIQLLNSSGSSTSNSNKTNKAISSSNFYLEYFPMYALFRKCMASDVCSSILQQLPDYSFANFLAERYHLLWMGGGGDRAQLRHPHTVDGDNLDEAVASNRRAPDGKRTRSGLPNSRLHYDRMENLMTVMTGSKTFYLFDPSQSEQLYGGSPVISATFSASISRNTNREKPTGITKNTDNNKHESTTNEVEVCAAGGSETCLSEETPSGSISVVFERDPNRVILTPNEYHTYSPVNIHSPNLTQYPKFAEARGIVCEVAAGDTIFVPSHWWHEVISTPDEEGKSIGSNMFFEPWYSRPGFDTRAKSFQKNRFYAHLQTMHLAKPCSKKKVCWTKEVNKSSSALPVTGEDDKEHSTITVQGVMKTGRTSAHNLNKREAGVTSEYSSHYAKNKESATASARAIDQELFSTGKAGPKLRSKGKSVSVGTKAKIKAKAQGAKGKAKLKSKPKRSPTTSSVSAKRSKTRMPRKGPMTNSAARRYISTS